MASLRRVGREELLRTISSLRKDTIETLQSLVRFASYTGTEDEGKAQDFVESMLAEMGFETRRVAALGSGVGRPAGFSPPVCSAESRFNIVGALPVKGRSGVGCGRSVAFNAHIDVVPVEEKEDEWSAPPFGGEVRNGQLYGRGAGDMKGGLVAVIVALRALASLGFRPAGRVLVHSVLEEECTGNGACAVVADWLTQPDDSLYAPTDAVLIPEPLPGIMRAQLGVMWTHVVVRGKPVHVLDTSAGSNAIEACFQLYSSLKQLESRWNEDRDAFPEAYQHLQHPINFNLGKIQGGAWASSVPSQCKFSFRVGFFPDTPLAHVRAEIEKNLSDTSEASGGLNYSVSYEGFQAEGYTFDDIESHPMGQTLAEAHERITKTPPVFSSATCTTDARFYYLYSNKTPVTCYGPEAKNIHGIDENVSIASIESVAAVFASFIEDWCGLTET